MPRKFIRRYLPSYDTIKGYKAVAMFGPMLRHRSLWHLNRRSCAGGVAVGFICGLIPGPLQVLTSTLLAVMFKVNLPVAVLVTFYTNPVTIVPLYLIAYQLGLFLVGGNGGPPPAAIDLWSLPLGEWIPAMIDWMKAMGRPFVVGLVTLDVLLAIAGYFVAWWGWRLHVINAWRRRRARRASAG